MTIPVRLKRLVRGFVCVGAAGLVAAASAQQLPYGGSGAPSAPPPPSAGYGAPGPDAAAPAPVRRGPRTSVQPYLEYNQVVSAELAGDGDVLTYSVLAAGVDGRVQTRRVTAQMSYRYERRIAWNGDLGDNDVHSGLAQIGAELVPGLLNVEAGALAARTSGDGRFAGPGARDSASQVYSVYAGPSLSTHAGPVAINASYRLGYVHIDEDDVALAGLPRERFGSSTVHSATASVGMAPGRLPFGWTVGGGYGRESGGELDHRFEAAYVRGDVVVPVTPTLALTAGVGYEDIVSSQRDFLRSPEGFPLVTPGGRLVPDPAAPRVTTYDQSGIIYDGGIIWRPDPRTELQARAGRRYGGTTFAGSLQHRFNSRYGLRAEVYDHVQSLGRLIVNDLSNLPDDFDTTRDPFTGAIGVGGCVFGRDPGTGLCFDRTLQSISTGSFRGRGANLLVSGGTGIWDFGAGVGYNHRRFHRPRLDPPIAPLSDSNTTVYANLGRQLGRSASLNFDAYASWYDADLFGFDDLFNTGITASYRRAFLLDRMQLIGAVGLNHSSDGRDGSTVASGLVGLRYTF
jgi:hypothetical protein